MARRKRDEETGIEPKATDGVPDEDTMQKELDELAERRARAREGVLDDDAGAPIDGQEAGEEDDGQLFAYTADGRVTLGNLIPRNVPVEHAFVFSQARRKGAGELIPFGEDVLLVVRGKVASVKPTAKRDDEENLKSVTIETQIATKVVVQADSQQAMDLLAEVLAKRNISAA